MKIQIIIVFQYVTVCKGENINFGDKFGCFRDEQYYTDEASPYWRDLSSYANHIETNDITNPNILRLSTQLTGISGKKSLS